MLWAFAAFLTGIKPRKPTPVPRQRRTLAKQIKSLVPHDIHSAIEVATYGKKLTYMEWRLRFYYETIKEFEEMKAGKHPFGMPSRIIPKHNAFIEKHAKKDREALAKILLDAIDAKDENKVMEVASAIKFVKEMDKIYDRHRARILTWKWLLDGNREKMKLRDLALAIRWPKTKSEDGLSQLRKICKELKFPLERSKRVSRKGRLLVV